MSLFSRAAVLAALVTLHSSAQAQQPATSQPVYTYVEQMPTFPGGQAALFQAVSRTVQYPAEAQQQRIEGRVFVSFVVTETGNVRDAKAVKPVHPLLDAEAVRAVQALPAFIPGRQGGRAVAVAYTLPIQFKLPADTAASRDAQYPGGPEALAAYLAATPYPEAARAAQVQGRVYVQFEVDSVGKVRHVKALPPVADPKAQKAAPVSSGLVLLHTAAEQHLAAMPAWLPARRNSSPVTTRWTVPIDFTSQPAAPAARPLPYADQLPVFVGSTPAEPLRATIMRSLRYPAAAIRSRIQGETLVYFEVSEQGQIERVEVVQSSHPLLDAETVRAVKAQRIATPAQYQGRPVRVFCICPAKFIRI
ncbi:TonB family protein [Hymenobacter weizhouensis]|uniref:TonB family protein n=1 Tax=Hymenobacter sp. YIM 151500-1 TaxID=2987689 RepID=UPI0022262EF7|nr:TonB family protein [Hymenobacter sp. YIM 151500-1]UYZ62782.1 TonB family protein [Hymenobacter sp. YIM 151500-1]